MDKSILGDSIAALSTPRGTSALAVVRVSGPHSGDVLKALTGAPLPQVRVASLRRLLTRAGECIDEAIVTYFEGPNSYTGEDMVEFATHGNMAVVDLLLEEVYSIDGVRPARAGEYTKRALLKGKLTLDKVEAVERVIHAETRIQASRAAAQLNGSWSSDGLAVTADMVALAADIELALDFPELDEGVEEAIGSRLQDINSRLLALLNTLKIDDVRLGLPRVVLAGPPNAGKSTLLNRLAGRDVSIVDDVKGTTRDVIEAKILARGSAFVVLDTAGIHDEATGVESKGIERSKGALQGADVVVWMEPALNWRRFGGERGAATWIDVASRADEVDDSVLQALKNEGVLVVGADAPIDDLLEAVVAALPSQQNVERVSERIVFAVREAQLALVQACEAAAESLELASGHLQMGLEAMASIHGRRAGDDVLEALFARFCIGK